MPTSYGLSYSRNSLPRSECTIGACNARASATTCSWTPVIAASAAAANAAASSCRTCSHAKFPLRRNASVSPFRESPGSPYTRRTPAFSTVSTTRSEMVNDMGGRSCVVGARGMTVTRPAPGRYLRILIPESTLG